MSILSENNKTKSLFAVYLAQIKYESLHPKDKWPEWQERCTNYGSSPPYDGDKVDVHFSFASLLTRQGEAYFDACIDLKYSNVEVLLDVDVNSFNPQNIEGFIPRTVTPNSDGSITILG